MGEIEPHLPSLLTKWSFLSWDKVISNCLVQSYPVRIPKQPRLFQRTIACWQLRPFLKRTKQLKEHGGAKLICLHRAFNPMFYCLWYRKILCMLPKEKHKHQVSHKLSNLQWCPACKIHEWNSVTKFVGVTNQYLIWPKAHSRRRNSHPTLVGWLDTWDWITKEPSIKQNNTSPKDKSSKKN